jgi:thiol:disulfide interchange protein DsbA
MTRHLFAFLLAALSFGVAAEGTEPPAQPYEMVSPVQPTQSGDKIEVVELFWYGCPHCYHFEPALQGWLKKKPDDVMFRRIPALFNEAWVVQARAYYAAEALGVVDKLHQPLFDAIHQEGKRIMDEESIIKFAVSQGIPEKDFRDAYDSFAVDKKVRQAMMATRDYGITGVPAILVNGKYRTSPSLAGGPDDVLKVIDTLVAKERAK